ncbi:MAG: hypothetical protein GY940_45545 [bacterium]|nr:hypothetical protein [bacterium]
MSNRKPLELLSEMNESQRLVQSPGVGYYSGAPEPGSYLTGGAFAGKLTIMNTSYNLYLPDDVYGRVASVEGDDFVIPVAYGQELFRLNPAETLNNNRIKGTATAGQGSDANEPEETGYIVKAFTTGIFYTKPAPDSPPFVSVGDKIEKGKALGLIEVMKTFNQIIFHGTDDSTTGKVKNIYIKDSQEVKQGQRLFLIE